MSRRSQNLGREFITGVESFDFTIEAWAYVVEYCQVNCMQVFGPFKSSRKETILRTHFDSVCQRVDFFTEWLRFDTLVKMNILRSLFGVMVGYGVNHKYKGDVGSVHSLQDYEHIYVIHPDEYSEIDSLGGFYRRNVRGYGVDLKFCTVSERLTVYARYSMVAVFDEELILSILDERDRLENRERHIQYENILGNDGNSAPVSYNYSETIKAGSFYLDANNNLLSIQKDYADGDLMVQCTIVESDIPESIGNMVENSVSEAHELVMKYLQSLYNNAN